MAFSIKNWLDDGSTPHDAAAMKDLEERLSDYTDSIGGGVELGYAQITANATATTEADVAGLSTTVTVGARPIMVRAYAPQLQHSGSAFAAMSIFVGGSRTGTRMNGGVTSLVTGGLIEIRQNPAGGSYTYNVKLWGTNGIGGNSGTATIVCQASNPAFIQVVQL